MTISINFNLPFDEAVAQMANRGVVLPSDYYGKLQGLHKQLAFSIANIGKLDQLQGVLDSLTDHLKKGGTFATWQKAVDVQSLGLPKHRLDNIFRTNIQQAYNHGHWTHAVENQSTQGYLMYDAINDSRTRPAHKANDGIIRKIDDPIWRRIWFSRNVYRCRCRLISLTEEQAIARSGNAKGLYQVGAEDLVRDTSWDSVDVLSQDFLTVGIEKAVAKRLLDNAINPTLLTKFKQQQTALSTPSIIDKSAFSTWVDEALKPDYKARHEFKQVGVLPDFVMTDSDVLALKPVSNQVFISDYQLRHSQRSQKSSPLPIDILKQLPEKLESSRWFFDASHENLIAVFDVQNSTDIGKAVLQINFFRKKKEKLNVVVTSGMIDKSTLLMSVYREITNNQP